jgi:recombination protein RecT
MAVKTMLRQLISKWGVMSLEMQKAYEADMGVINQDGSIDYVDSPAADDTAQPVAVEVEASPEEVQTGGTISNDDFAAIMEG